MNFDQPRITADSAPVFTDARTCARWLDELPLANIGPSHGRLLGEIEELNGFEMLPGERIKVLEMLRDAVLFVQTEQSRKYTGKPVPLAGKEREVFLDVIALWNALGDGWRHCLHNLAQGIGGVSGQAALICQRALWISGAKFAEHYRIYQDFNAGEWRGLNRIFALARELGVAEQGVAHPVNKLAPAISCAETFAQIQLLALANPNEHAPRQQALIARWIERWGSKVKLVATVSSEPSAAPLSADLDSSACASRSPKTGGAIVYLDTEEIGKSLTKRVAALKQGETPESLQLGSDVTEGLAAQMLVTLHQQWCEDRTARQSQRRMASENARVCAGMAAIHYFVTGHPFESQAGAGKLSQVQREHLETFGQSSTRANDDYTVAHGFSIELWRVLDESLSGFRLERPRNSGNGRFLHQQLVAVRTSDAPSFSLCSVRWISLSENQVPRLGTRTFPGIATGIAARLGGLNVHSDTLVPALVLSAVPALRAPATLIVPAGWFRPRRLIEIGGGAMQSGLPDRVVLTTALDRGSDFERCTFEPAA